MKDKNLLSLTKGIIKNGEICLDKPVDIPNDTPVIIKIISQKTKPAQKSFIQNLRKLFSIDISRYFFISGTTLLGLTLVFYAITRFVNLSDFPIYFFTDEAIHPNWAAYLLSHGLKDNFGVLLPPYFLNDKTWNLSFSVYTHLVPVAIFGRSIFLTRAVPAFLSLVAALGMAIAMKVGFKSKTWWMAPAVFASLPAWLLHSRSGFETALMTSYYALFLTAYLLYIYKSPMWILAALPFGAAAAYSYTNGQILVAATGLLLLITDIQYHFKQFKSNKKLLVATIGIVIFLLIPYIRFRILEPTAIEEQLKTLSSYLVSNISIQEKLSIFFNNYFKGLDPVYWFSPENKVDIDRHVMKGMGALPMALAPFITLGIFTCIRNWRSSAHRLIIIAVLVTPISAALAAPGITRLLAMMVPATLLTCIGIDGVLNLFKNRVSYVMASTLAILLLILGGSLMTREALVNGPRWFKDYTLGGMQWGTSQVMQAIKTSLNSSKTAKVFMSPTWANNPNVFLDFFLTGDEQTRISIGSIQTYLTQKVAIDPDLLFVIPSYEYKAAIESKKLVIENTDFVIAYPDDTPGFYGFHARYSSDADKIFAQESLVRQQLVTTSVNFKNMPLKIGHSQLDIGEINNIFDGKKSTLARGKEANPFIIEIYFDTPQDLQQVSITTGSMDTDLKIILTTSNNNDGKVFQKTYRQQGDDPTTVYEFSETQKQISKLRLEIRNLNDGVVSNVHIREVDWK